MIDLDLPLFLKETQLQHGLRGEDYDRYHKYISNRVATLRKQLHLSNEKKKFLHKDITPSNATCSSHFLLLAFYAERCWSSSETMQARLGEAVGRAGSVGDTGSAGGRPAPTVVVGEKSIKGGFPPPGQYRKRLNKAVKWAEKLMAIAEAVGSSRVKKQCKAYLAEVQGRCHLGHGNEMKAKECFQQARELYYDLLLLSLTGSPIEKGESGSAGTSSNPTKLEATSLSERKEEESRSVLQQKVYEMDDRIVYCMQRLKEDVASYSPPSVEAALKLHEFSSQKSVEEGGDGVCGEQKDARNGGGAVSSALLWNGRPLTVYSMKIKDAVREANAVPVEELERKALEYHSMDDRSDKTSPCYRPPLHGAPSTTFISSSTPLPASKRLGGCVVPVGLVNRVLDALDRRIGYYNDALAHARQDLRAAVEETSHKTTLQLIVHYLLYHVAEGTLHRRLFLAEMYARRFQATEIELQYKLEVEGGAVGSAASAPGESKLKKKRKKEVLPQSQYASPIEVIRLYETAMETVGDMGLLPGVAGQEDLEAYEALCVAGKALYIGEACRIKGDLLKAETGYRTAMDTLLKKDNVFGLSKKVSSNTGKNARNSVRKEEEKNRNALLARAELMYAQAEQLALQVASLRALNVSSSLSKSFSSLSSISYLSDAVAPGLSGTSARMNTERGRTEIEAEDGERKLVAAVAKHVIPFPPSYQIAPAKPTFVDIACTYVDFGLDEKTKEAREERFEWRAKDNVATTSSRQASKGKRVDPISSGFESVNKLREQVQSTQQKSELTENDSPTGDQGKKKWGFKWRWGSS